MHLTGAYTHETDRLEGRTTSAEHADLQEPAPRVAYLITTHKNPAQIDRLVRAVRRGSPHAPIVVHHNYEDSYLDPELFADLDGVHLVRNERPLEWGDWSLQQRVLDALRWALAHVEFDWLVLVSGQDYPLQPLAAVEEYLRTTPYDAVFAHRPVERGEEAWRRYNFRYYRLPFSLGRAPRAGEKGGSGGGRGRPGPKDRLARWLLHGQSLVTLKFMPGGLASRVGVRYWRTPFGPGLRCYKGAAWLTVRRTALERAIAFVDAHPLLVAHYRRTIIPEESMLQTVLANDPQVRTLDRTLRFVVWDPAGEGSPRVLGMDHLDAVLASGRYFARKFDPATDAEVLDRLDEALAAAPGPAGTSAGPAPVRKAAPQAGRAAPRPGVVGGRAPLAVVIRGW